MNSGRGKDVSSPNEAVLGRYKLDKQATQISCSLEIGLSPDCSSGIGMKCVEGLLPESRGS